VIELIIIYLVSMLVSAFLSMFELAILTINPIKLKILIEKKGHLIFFEQKKDKAATDIMVFNFLWDYCSAMITSALIARHYGENIFMVFTASIITALGMLYVSTLGAKMFANKRPDLVLRYLGRVIIVIYYVMKPALFFISSPILILLRVLLNTGDGEKLSDSELLGVLAMAKRDGLMAARAHQFVKRVVGLTSQQVKDLLPKDQLIESVDVGANILDLKNKINEPSHKRIVVTKTHNEKIYPIGILLHNDIVRTYVNYLECKVAGTSDTFKMPRITELMHPCVVTQENTPAPMLLTKLESGDHIVVAVNNEGVMTGIMQSDDIIRALTERTPSPV
jgi:CBS domain containing-hemolysin-like protein